MGKNIFALLALLHFCAETSYSQNDGVGSSDTFLSKDFWVKITIAVVSAALAFIGSYVLAQLKRRQEPKKQLSYDVSIRKGLFEIGSEIKDNVQVLYKNQVIEGLYHVACNVENTGNTVIKNQFIRFEFSQESRLLDCFLDPIPEKEIGVQEVENLSSGDSGKRYLIKHVERSQKVGFRFIVTAPSNVTLTLHPFNEEGGVDFVPRSISKIQEENFYIVRFITLYLIYELVPPVLLIIPFELGRLAAALVRFGILIVIFPTLKPFAVALTNLISRVSSRRVASQVTIDEIKAETLNIHTLGKIEDRRVQDRCST